MGNAKNGSGSVEKMEAVPPATLPPAQRDQPHLQGWATGWPRWTGRPILRNGSRRWTAVTMGAPTASTRGGHLTQWLAVGHERRVAGNRPWATLVADPPPLSQYPPAFSSAHPLPRTSRRGSEKRQPGKKRHKVGGERENAAARRPQTAISKHHGDGMALSIAEPATPRTV